jgi:hypothetical protein
MHALLGAAVTRFLHYVGGRLRISVGASWFCGGCSQKPWSAKTENLERALVLNWLASSANHLGGSCRQRGLSGPCPLERAIRATGGS